MPEAGRRGGHTVGVLTRRIAAGEQPASISVRTGTLAAGAGFSGFLIGAGAGQLHWRAAALVMAASGQGGGLLATYDSDGNVRFREHTSESSQFAYAELVGDRPQRAGSRTTMGEDVVLRLDITPTGAGTSSLTLAAGAFSGGRCCRRRRAVVSLTSASSAASP